MTDRELADAAWHEFSLTTDSFPTWVRKGRPSTSHWAHGKVFLDQIGVEPPPPPPPPPPGDPLLRRIPVPAYSSGATICSTPADALDALRTKIGGELVVRGVSLPGSGTLDFHRDCGGLKVWFEDSPFIGYPAGSTPLYGCWIKQGAANLSLYGIDVTNPAGTGIGITGGAHDITLVGKVHGVGAQGFFIAANYSQDVWNLNVDIDTSDAGNDLSQDPHAEKGTGLHVAYIGSSPTGNVLRDSKLTIVGHDGDTGSIQVGQGVSNVELWIDARRLTKVATSQVAGSPFQPWGDNVRNVTVRYLYAEDCAGRVVEAGVGATPGPVTVEYARWLRCATNPKVGGQALDTGHGIVYGDCKAL